MLLLKIVDLELLLYYTIHCRPAVLKVASILQTVTILLLLFESVPCVNFKFVKS